VATQKSLPVSYAPPGLLLFLKRQHRNSMEIRTEIEIAASAARVWEELTNFASYGQWNPFIRSIRGEAAEGHRLIVRIQSPGRHEMTFRPVVLAAKAPHELRWLGKVLFSGLFDGEHSFQLYPLDGQRTRFVQREIFRGVLVPLFAKQLNNSTKRGFELMNEALKIRAESERADLRDTKSLV
jgi:hypothetical protein